MRKIKCEIYSRAVGYYRPVSQWNKGKQEEFKERKSMIIKKGIKDEMEMDPKDAQTSSGDS